MIAIALLLTDCAGQGQASPESQTEVKTEISHPPSTTTQGAVPSPALTEESKLPYGKLLNPCALISADLVEELLGDTITGDWRISYSVPTTAYLWGYEPYTRERILYYCRYLAGETADKKVEIGVEVFSRPEDAQTQMELYKGWLQSEEALISNLGEKSYGFAANPSEGLAAANYPIIYLLSGNYLVTINILPSPTTNQENDAYVAKVLEFGRQALVSLTQEIISAMPDQDYHLDESWQPSGKPIEPCELITSEDAQRYMDNPISFEQSSTYWGLAYGGAGGLQPHLGTICSYRSSYRVGTLQGLPEMEGVEFTIDQISDEDKELYITRSRERNLKEVTGIGDTAFSDPTTGEDIVVLQGNMVISLLVGNSSDSDSQFQSAFELAQLILSQLPKYDLQFTGLN